jgi:hypothetical protein
MNCNHVQNLISAFIDDELSADEKRNLRRHLFFCPDCHSEYENLLKLKDCLNNLNQEDCNYDLLAGFKLRLAEAEHSFFQETNRFLMLGRLGLVTGCVTMFFFSTIALFPKGPSPSQLAQTPQPFEVAPTTDSATVNQVEMSTFIDDGIDSVDQNFSLDEPVTVYQASSILP